MRYMFEVPERDREVALKELKAFLDISPLKCIKELYETIQARGANAGESRGASKRRQPPAQCRRKRLPPARSAAVTCGASKRLRPSAEVDGGLSNGEDNGDDDREEDRVEEDEMDYTPLDDLPPTKKQKALVWHPDAPPPTFTPRAAYALAQLGTISSSIHLSELDQLILQLVSDAPSMSDHVGDTLDAIVGRVRIWDKITASYDLKRMVDYMKLALILDKLTPKIELKGWCDKHDVVYNTMWRWRHKGLRLLQLVSGGTIYILLIIAMLDLRVYFESTLGTYDLQLICGMLRRPLGE
jgi:hypothetical protein